MWTSYVEGCPGVLTVRQVVLDAGAVQSGPLHVDVIKTLEEYGEALKSFYKGFALLLAPYVYIAAWLRTKLKRSLASLKVLSLR